MSSYVGAVAGGVEARPLKRNPRSYPRSRYVHFLQNSSQLMWRCRRARKSKGDSLASFEWTATAPGLPDHVWSVRRQVRVGSDLTKPLIQDGIEELGDRAAGFQDGAAMVHGACEIGVGKGDA